MLARRRSSVRMRRAAARSPSDRASNKAGSTSRSARRSSAVAALRRVVLGVAAATLAGPRRADSRIFALVIVDLAVAPPALWGLPTGFAAFIARDYTRGADRRAGACVSARHVEGSQEHRAE